MEFSNTTETIINTINTILTNLFTSIDEGLYKLLDELFFIDENLLTNSNITKIIGDSNSGIILIVNALFLGICLYFAFNYLFSYLFSKEVESPLKFVLKAIVFLLILQNASFICSYIINIFSLISESIISVGETLLKKEISFSTLIGEINAITSSTNNYLSILGITNIGLKLSLLNLLISYGIRYLLILFSVVSFPFFLLFLIKDSTRWIFNSFFKTFMLSLFSQVFVSFILLILFTLLTSENNLLNSILVFSGIFVLSKSNVYMKEIFEKSAAN